METTIVDFENVPLVVPSISGHPMEFVHNTFEGYPSRCGAGSGIGDKVVPETIFGLPASPVCDIHDFSWDVAEATWADFHQANSMFLHNLLAVIAYRSKSSFMQHLRNYRAVTFYNTVDTLGAPIFWKLKKA